MQAQAIGKAFAEALAARGHDCIITGRRTQALENLASELRERYSVDVETAAFDLADPEATESFAKGLSESGRVGILVNNAGFGSGNPFSLDGYPNQERMLRVHIDASTRLAHAVLGGMKSRGEGAIINVASLAGFVPNPSDALYSATKAYLIRFSESLQLELAGTGIRVQALCPGFIRTEFHERLGNGKDFNRKSRGIYQWMEAGQIVEQSLRALESHWSRVVVVPGLFYKFLFRLNHLLPRRVAYAQVLKRYRSRE